MDGSKKCLGTRKDGTSCKALALPASDFCYFHDPARAEERQQARKKGGHARRKPVLLSVEKEKTQLDTVFNVTQALATAYRAVASGKMDVRIANCLGFLGGHILKGLHECQLAQQIELLNFEHQKIKEMLKKEQKDRSWDFDPLPPLTPDESRMDGAGSETVVRPETTEGMDRPDGDSPEEMPPKEDSGDGEDIPPLFG